VGGGEGKWDSWDWDWDSDVESASQSESEGEMPTMGSMGALDRMVIATGTGRSGER
jgi:hypothetical protein